MLPLGQRNVFQSAGFWLGALYVGFPMGLLLYGWNDIVDFVVVPVISSAEAAERSQSGSDDLL